MKAKVKFDKDQLKTFCVKNVEKFVFGAMVLTALLLCWSAIGLSPYKGTPDELKKKANDVTQRVQSSTPPETFTDLPPKRDLNGMLRHALANVNPGLFPMSEISRPYADRKIRRQQPKLLAVLDPKAQARFGAIATSENGGRIAARRGQGMMAGDGGMEGMMMPEGGAMPGGAEMPDMSDMMKPGGAAGMMPGMEGMAGMEGMQGAKGRGKKKPAKKPVEKAKPKVELEPEKFALAIPSGAKLEGKYWVSVTGLIPAWDQEAEYQKVFRDATKTYPTDTPQYVSCAVERAEVLSPGEVGEYEAVEEAAFEYMDKWASEYPELVDEKYLLPSLDVTEPLPPLVLANHDPNAVRHPKIPLKDEVNADANKAQEADGEADADTDKKKPKRGNRLRGRAGGMQGGGMPGMPGGMPGMPGGGMGATAGMGGMPGMGMGGMPGMGEMPGMGMGIGGRMGQPSREKIEYKLFRFFDFAVTPGKSYKYRVRLILANPNYGKPKRYLADPKLADEEILYTDWSEPTPEVFVPHGSELLAGDINSKAQIPHARVMVRQFDQANAITAVHVFDLARGGTANQTGVKVPMPPKSGVPDKAEGDEEIDFNSNATLVDLSGGDNLSAGPKGKTPGRMLVMRSDGELALLSQFSDAERFGKEQALLDQEKNKQSGTLPAAEEQSGGGAADGGFGGFFKDEEPTKKRRGR